MTHTRWITHVGHDVHKTLTPKHKSDNCPPAPLTYGLCQAIISQQGTFLRFKNKKYTITESQHIQHDYKTSHVLTR